MLHFLNESLFAAIQPLQNLDRLSLSLTTLKNASLALQLLAAIISVRLQSPCPTDGRTLGQHLCRKTRKFLTMPLSAPVGALPLGFLSKQLSPSSASLSAALLGLLCHLLLSAVLPFTKTPNPFLLARRTTGKTECQQPQHAM